MINVSLLTSNDRFCTMTKGTVRFWEIIDGSVIEVLPGDIGPEEIWQLAED